MRQSQSACLFPHLRRSSMSILDALLSKWPTSVRTLSTSSEIEVPLLTGWCRWASVGGYEKAPSKRRMGYTISWALSHVLLFCSSIFITPLAWILPRTVLLGREKMTRFIPSNSSNLTGGGGSSGTRRMTDDSTWGGGRKSFRETLMTLSTFA